MALIALVVLGIVIYVSGGIQNLWTAANTSLANADTPLLPRVAERGRSRNRSPAIIGCS